MGKRRKMNTLKTKRGVTPLFIGFTHLYIQFEDFETYGEDIPAAVRRAMEEVKQNSDLNKSLTGNERKAIVVPLGVGRELFPYIKATVTPIQKDSAAKGNEHRTFWMP